MPLYILQANDDTIQFEDNINMSKHIREGLLRRVSPDDTKGLPSFLPLYQGMRLGNEGVPLRSERYYLFRR